MTIGNTKKCKLFYLNNNRKTLRALQNFLVMINVNDAPFISLVRINKHLGWSQLISPYLESINTTILGCSRAVRKKSAWIFFPPDWMTKAFKVYNIKNPLDSIT